MLTGQPHAVTPFTGLSMWKASRAEHGFPQHHTRLGGHDTPAVLYNAGIVSLLVAGMVDVLLASQGRDMGRRG